MANTDGIIAVLAVGVMVYIIQQTIYDDARAGARDIRFSYDSIPNPDSEDQFIEGDSTNIESGGGFGGGYRSRIESVLKGDSVGL